MFAMLHRALNEGARTLGKAQQRVASATALGADVSQWKPVNQPAPTIASNLPLHAGVLKNGDRIVALNRPPGEDLSAALSPTALNELFAGLDFRVLTDSIEKGRSLTSEIWRTFLIAMALALLGEALLCMPPQREVKMATAV
jgi:hypothetical protein